MKKLIVVAAGAFLMIASGAVAQEGYIGLFIDSEHSQSCVTGAGFYPVNMWVWVLPGSLGAICTEFKIQYPYNLIQSTTTWNDFLISVILGDLYYGVSACYAVCQHNWFWIAEQLLYVTDPTQGWIEIIPHPDPDLPCGVVIATCEPGYPCACTTVYSQLGINRVCPPDNPIAVEGATWGAIKELYR